MKPNALLGLSALASLIASIVCATTIVWPRVRTMPRSDGLVALVAPHLFLRFIGLSFLIPGVVSPTLPAAFAVPAAYGDLIAGALAIVAIIAVTKRLAAASALVWTFNVWGAADLLFAVLQGQRLGIEPGSFGATYFIPTAIVPPLLVLHALLFLVLLSPREPRR